MSELIIDRALRMKLRAESHGLDPLVLLGQNGLTDAVLKEIEKALNAHELVKIRIPGEDREEKDEIVARIADATSSAVVQKIGKTVTVWRPAPEEKKKEEQETLPASVRARAEKPRSRGGKILKTDKKKLAAKKTPIRRAHPKRKRTVKKAMGA